MGLIPAASYPMLIGILGCNGDFWGEWGFGERQATQIEPSLWSLPKVSIYHSELDHFVSP